MINKLTEKVNAEAHRNHATLMAMRFLGRQDELRAWGIEILEVRTATLGTRKTATTVTARYTPSNGKNRLYDVLGKIFDTCPVLGYSNLAGPFQAGRGVEYRLGEYGTNGEEVNNTIVRILCPQVMLP